MENEEQKIKQAVGTFRPGKSVLDRIRKKILRPDPPFTIIAVHQDWVKIFDEVFEKQNKRLDTIFKKVYRPLKK